MKQDKPKKPRKSRAKAAAAPAEPAQRGRPTDYTPEIGLAICIGLMEGQSLRRICADEAMPGRTTVYGWLLEHDDFANRYARAREVQAETYVDEIADIADDATNDFMEKQRADGSTTLAFDGEHVQRSKLRIDARKWAAAKLAPKKFGDKLEIEHGGAIAHPPAEDPDAARAEITRFLEAERARQLATGQTKH